MKLPLSVLNFGLRLIEKRHLRRETSFTNLRRRFSQQARLLFPAPPFAAFLPDRLCVEGHAVDALWVNAGLPSRDGVILYLHGGAYVFGGSDTHRAMLARLSALTGLRTVLPDYRMAPEHPFPAAPEDALIAYKALLARGYRPSQIVLGGDSAGGGLTLSLLYTICSAGLPRPGVVFAFSPWTDLTLSGESLKTNRQADPVLPTDRIEDMRDIYLDGASPRDPKASPLFGNFKGAPPVMISVGDTEILLDDSRRMAASLKAQDVNVRLDVWENAPHVWQIFQGRLSEADCSLKDVAAFINQHLPA